MTTKTITSVVDEIEDWQSQYGDIMYSVVAFAGNEMIKANKKSHDAALELQGLLKEAIGIPQEFVLGEAGLSKAGNQKWKLMAFGPVDGPLTYSTLKDGKVPGGGGGDNSADTEKRSAPPPGRSTEESITRAVALKAAAIAAQGLDTKRILVMAEEFEAWLKDSGSASSAYDIPSTETSASSHQADADPGATSVSADDSGGQGEPDATASGLGEASCPPHQLNLDVAAKAGRYPCRRCGAWVNPRAQVE